MDDNLQTTSQKPNYIKSDNDTNVLNNFDISTQKTTANLSNESTEIQNDVYSQFGYSSPYANQNLTQQAPQAQSVPPSVTSSTQQYPPQPFPQVRQPEVLPVQKNQVVYEKTVIEKGPGFFSVLFSQIFRFIGCFLFIASIAIGVIVYIINF